MSWTDDDVAGPATDTWTDKDVAVNTLGQEAKRQGGLVLRNALSAAGSLGVIPADAIGKAVNYVAGREVIPNQQHALQQTLTRMGLPVPERSLEKFTQGVAESAPAMALPGGFLPQALGNAAVNSTLAEPGQEGKQAALGAALGTLGHVVGGVVRPTEAAKVLLDKGVALTPGQAAGAGTFINRFEQLAASNPVSSSAIHGAQRRAVEDANVGAAQVVAQQVQQGIKLGRHPREAIEQTREVISNAYDNALEGVSIPLASAANTFQDMLPTIGKNHPMVPTEEITKAGKYIEGRFRGMWDQGVRDLSGTQIKQIDSEIGQHIRDLSRSTNAADKTAVPLWRDLQEEVRDRIVKSVPPEQGAMLSRANAAYRELLALEKSMLPGADAFTPRKLRATLEKMNNGRIPDSELGRFATAMQQTLPNTVPNSGTAERLIANSLPALLMSGGAGANAMGYNTIGTGLLAAGALGSRTGARALTGSLAGQQAFVNALRQSTPSIGAVSRQKDNE